MVEVSEGLLWLSESSAVGSRKEAQGDGLLSQPRPLPPARTLSEHCARGQFLVLELPHDGFHTVFQLQLAFLERGFFEQFGFG